jgi:hypothetical protein
MMVAAALSMAAAVEEKKSDKSLTEKTTETLSKAGEKTKDAGKSLVNGTKKAVDGLVDAVTPDKDARKVEVKLTDSHLGIPAKLEPGKTAFVVKNEGKEKHGFEVSGESMDKRFFVPVAPGESKVLHMDLKPGKYKAFAPENGKEHEAISANITVK